MQEGVGADNGVREACDTWVAIGLTHNPTPNILATTKKTPCPHIPAYHDFLYADGCFVLQQQLHRFRLIIVDCRVKSCLAALHTRCGTRQRGERWVVMGLARRDTTLDPNPSHHTKQHLKRTLIAHLPRNQTTTPINVQVRKCQKLDHE